MHHEADHIDTIDGHGFNASLDRLVRTIVTEKSQFHRRVPD
jgi:hypothetical protein